MFFMADRVLYIKNMVCDRCVMVVRERLLALGLEVETVELGRALLGRPATDEERAAIRSTLEAVGFELLDDPRSRLVERTRALIIDWARLPGRPSSPGLQRLEQALFRGDGDDDRALRHRPADRAGKGAAELWRVLAGRDRRPLGLFERRAPQQPVQAGRRADAKCLSPPRPGSEASGSGLRRVPCGFVGRRKGKNLFLAASSLDERAKNSFLWLRHSTKGQKSLFCGFVTRRRGKNHFSEASSVDEGAKNIFP